MTFRADLHCHSNVSDGSLTPKELIKLAKTVGLSALSITDHDTLGAYPDAISAAKKEGILLGTGIELSSFHKGQSIHILGYDVDLSSQDLNKLCEGHVKRRKERNAKILEKLGQHGMPIDESDLQNGHRTKGRPHIALAMMKKGYVQSVQEAFDRFLGDGKPCYDPGAPFSSEETIEVIKTAGGKAFLAHPHFLTQQKTIDRILALPFDGIECYYSRLRPEIEQSWVQRARRLGLLISGGSDFHGKIKPDIPLGCSWVDKETFDRIFTNNLPR